MPVYASASLDLNLRPLPTPLITMLTPFSVLLILMRPKMELLSSPHAVRCLLV